MEKDRQSTKYGFDNPIEKHDTDERIIKAVRLVADRLCGVNEANRLYKEACTELGHLKVVVAKERGHPWNGFHVWRSVKTTTGKNIFERGVVMFKDFGTEDYGNPAIPPGRFFVLNDKGQAKFLDTSWQLELI